MELLRLASRRLWAAWVRNSTEEWIVVKASLHSSRASAQPVGYLCFVLSRRLDGSERMGLWMEARTGSVNFGGQVEHSLFGVSAAAASKVGTGGAWQ